MLMRDFDGNGWLDVGFQLPRSDAVQVFLNQDGQRFNPVASKYTDPAGVMPNIGWLHGFVVELGKPSFVESLNRRVPDLAGQAVRLVLRADIDGNGFPGCVVPLAGFDARSSCVESAVRFSKTR